MLELKVVADDRIPFLRGVLEPYFKSVVYLPGAATDAAAVRDAAVIITRTRTKCDAALLAGSTVELVVSATIGYDHFDTAYLDASGIAWSNAPGCNSGSVKQYITSALLNTARKHNFALRGRTLGVIGVGNVGSKVAAAGRALGMLVLENDPPRAEREGSEGFTPLAELLARADVVTVHVPLEKDGEYPTWQLADAGFFAAMRPGSLFFNSSRGEVCSGAALKAALKSGQLAGAVLDVWENEPDIDLELLATLDFATPHIAGYSTNGKANGTAQCVNRIGRRFGIPELADWYPADVPTPENPRIRLPETGSFEEKMAAAVNATYDIAFDDRLLRADPATFEHLRGTYRQRLEFSSYEVEAAAPEERRALAALGFKTI